MRVAGVICSAGRLRSDGFLWTRAMLEGLIPQLLRSDNVTRAWMEGDDLKVEMELVSLEPTDRIRTTGETKP